MASSCDPTQPGWFRCFALQRTDIPTRLATQITAARAPDGYGPEDLRAAYALASSGGSGRIVAAVDAYDQPYAEEDLAVYRSQFGLPACTTANGCFRKVDEHGGTRYPDVDTGWGSEVDLDLQMISAICPQCRILLVEADSSDLYDLSQAVDTAASMGAVSISNSYGEYESGDASSFDSHFDHPGVAVVASTGDAGYGVQFPASSGTVVAAGGTSLTPDSNARGWTETAWDGAGSGCSALEPKPAWQHDSGCSNRTVADISAVSDPYTGVAVYDPDYGGWGVWGGTSVASPIIATLIAIAHGPTSAAYPASDIYSHTAGLNDVTSGFNGTCLPAYLCTSRAGYDGPTGLGTPIGLTAFVPSSLRIRGTITDPNGAPAGGIEVSARSGTFSVSGRATASGTYSLAVLAGSYTLAFYDPSDQYPAGYYSSGGYVLDESSATPVTVGSSSVAGLNVQFPGHYIKGTVTGTGARPLANIDVRASSSGYDGHSTTAADGTYSMYVLAGTYKVSVSDSSGVYLNGYYSGTGFTLAAGSATPVAVGSADVTGVNVQLPTGHHIRGTVIGPDDNPIADIDVSANSSSYSGHATTNADGAYSIDVPAGTYTVGFSDPIAVNVSGFYSDSGYVTDLGSATPVSVGSADVTGIDVYLPFGYFLAGTVTAPGGAPLAGIHVIAIPAGWWGPGAIDDTTDADGTYRLLVSAGYGTGFRYDIYFEDPKGTYLNGYYSAGGFTLNVGSATSVLVDYSDVSGIDVELATGRHIEGAVTGTGGKPLADIDVTVSSPTYYGRAATAANGKYSLSVPAGSYSVSFSDPNDVYYSGFYASDGFTLDGGSATPAVVRSADVTGIDVQLPVYHLIRGTVTNPNGTPLEGIEVEADSSSGYGYSATTAADGTYSMHVPDDAYFLSFSDPSDRYLPGYYSPSGLVYNINAAAEVIVSSSDVAGISVQFLNSHAIEGKITGPDGMPIGGILINANQYVATSADDGTYSVVVSPGSYELSVLDPTDTYVPGFYSSGGLALFGSSATSVTVSSSNVEGIDLQLPSGFYQVAGKVTGSGAVPLKGILVEVESTRFTADMWAGQTWTAADGAYSVYVPDGSDYRLYFSDPSGRYVSGYYSSGGFTLYSASATPVAVTAPRVTGLDVKLPNGRHIKGTVIGPDGRPLSNIGVSASSSGYSGQATTDSNGLYSIDVPAGKYKIGFSDPTYGYVAGYYSSGGFVLDSGSATVVSVSSSDVTGINVSMPGTATQLAVSGIPSPCVAGDAQGVVVTALDAHGNTATAYRGTIHFTSTDARAVMPANYTFTAADNGVHAFPSSLSPALVFGTVGTQRVRVRDTATATITGAQGEILVTPAAAATLIVSGFRSPTVSRALHSVTVAARDRFGNTAAGYLGTVHFTSSDAAAKLPADYSFTAADKGVHVFVVALTTYGTQSISATDTLTAGITGSQQGISVSWPASSYTPTQPRRVLDSRPTATSGNPVNIGLSGKFVAGTVRTFGVAGASYVGGGKALAVPKNAVAVTGNLTVAGESAGGVIDLGPTVTSAGDTSALHFVKGDIRANNVTLGLAADGTLEAVYRSSTAGATTDVIFDVTGYFVAGTSGATYHSLAPGRVLDTRPTSAGGGVTHEGSLSKLPNRTVETFTVAQAPGLGWPSALVPKDAVAITGNVTVTNATSAGYVALGPTMTANPSTSTVNVARGANVSNGVTTALAGGKLSVVWCGTSGSSADLIFDVTGYFTAGPGGLTFSAVAPVRVLDSSRSIGLSGAFSTRKARLFTVGGTAAVPADAAAIAGDLTVLSPTSAGWALISPEIVASPATSTVNVASGQSEANGFDIGLGASGHVALVWSGATGSTADLALDVTGYWR